MIDLEEKTAHRRFRQIRVGGADRGSRPFPPRFEQALAAQRAPHCRPQPVNGRALAVGMEAKRMIGRTPAYIRAIRPLRDGVIADFDITEKMLRYFIQKVHRRRWARPRIVVALSVFTPAGKPAVEIRL